MVRTSGLWTAIGAIVVVALGCGDSPSGQSAPVTATAMNGGAGAPSPAVSGTAGTPPVAATGVTHTPAKVSAAGSGGTVASSSVPASSGAAGSGGQVAPSSTAGTLAGVAGIGAAGNSGGGGAGAAPADTQRIPCDVAAILFNRCRSCHGMPTNLGAPMSLVTWADLQRPAVTDPTKKVHELVAARIQDTARPMPPAMDGKISAADKALLTMWSMQGAPALASGAADCPK